MPKSREQQAIELAGKLGVVRSRDLVERGIHAMTLTRLVRKGKLLRTGRGVYILPDADLTAEHGLAEAAKRVPNGTVCLLSALAFHDLTTASPHEVWMAISRKARKPKIDHPRIRFVRFSGDALTEGVETHRVEKVPVRVYSPAKTVADCFKYRRKIGLDLALEALRETWQKKKATMDELWDRAKICRVSNVMRPYLESVVT